MAKEKIGRNRPCPCGSGKKFKKCHGPIQTDLRRGNVPQRVLEWVMRTQDERRTLEDRGIYVNYVKPVLFQGRKVWALGSGLVLSDNPKQTFHEFITGVLIDTLGRHWWEEQLRLPDDQRHFVPTCFLRLREWQRAMAAQAEEVRPEMLAAYADLVTYFLSLAFDVTTMRQVLNLPGDLVARLRHKDQFQGARYEVAVAAMLARIDAKSRSWMLQGSRRCTLSSSRAFGRQG